MGLAKVSYRDYCLVQELATFRAAEQLDGADPASPGFGFGAILVLGWLGGSSRGR